MQTTRLNGRSLAGGWPENGQKWAESPLGIDPKLNQVKIFDSNYVWSIGATRCSEILIIQANEIPMATRCSEILIFQANEIPMKSQTDTKRHNSQD